jgi:hypothetical protein
MVVELLRVEILKLLKRESGFLHQVLRLLRKNLHPSGGPVSLLIGHQASGVAVYFSATLAFLAEQSEFLR